MSWCYYDDFTLCVKIGVEGIAKIGEAKLSSDAITFAKKIEKLRKKLMASWYIFKEGDMSRQELIQETKPVRLAIEKHLESYKDSQEKCCVPCLVNC